MECGLCGIWGMIGRSLGLLVEIGFGLVREGEHGRRFGRRKVLLVGNEFRCDEFCRL